MDLTVLERQRAMLQRIYQDHLDIDSTIDHHHHHHQHPTVHQTNDQNSRSSSSASALTTLPPLKPDLQCNSNFPHKPNKKRKAELDIEIDNQQQEEAEADEKSDITTKTNTSSKGSLAEKQDYIHVRARRGQATDSHSLAERARREKISKKMKNLQDLVPGCNKVTGKAGMLDEIINYVQSLQKQVEFLSMKLATINPRLDFSIDNLFAKEIPAYIASLPTAAAASQLEATNSACFQYNQILSNLDQSHQILSQKAGTSSLPIPEMFLDSSCISQLQQLPGWESDWQNPFSAGFP